MRIQILSSAIEDLDAGREFYDSQEWGVGEYFLDCLYELREAATMWNSMSFASAHDIDMVGRTTHSEQERINATWRIECFKLCLVPRNGRTGSVRAL